MASDYALLSAEAQYFALQGVEQALEVIDLARDSLNPDLGYWAARWDPSGLFHPLYYTTHSGGKWVNVTTVSALDIEFPLYLLAGYRGALLISMAGAVLTALALFAIPSIILVFGGTLAATATAFTFGEVLRMPKLAIKGFGVNGGMTRQGLEIVTKFATENGAKSIPIESWSDFRFQDEALNQIGRVAE